MREVVERSCREVERDVVSREKGRFKREIYIERNTNKESARERARKRERESKSKKMLVKATLALYTHVKVFRHIKVSRHNIK